MYILSLFPSQVPYVLSYRSIYSQINTVGYFSNVLLEVLVTNGLRQTFAKLSIPKLSLHNSVALCLQQKLRRDLPETETF